MKGYALTQALLSHEAKDVRVLDALGEPVELSITFAEGAVILAPVKQVARDALSLDAYQMYACFEAIYPEHGKGSNKSITITLAGLVAETGKAMSQWFDTLRESTPLVPDTKRTLAVSLGHALWYCAALAQELGLSMSELGQASIRQARAWRREQELAERQAELRPRNRTGERE